MKRAPALAPGVCAVLLIAAQALFVAAYVSREHTIYFWDHAMYFGMARQAYETWARDYAAGRDLFRHSLAQNYNLVFALPSFISFALFGVSRLVFILGNFFAFFLAYEIAVAFLLRALPGFGWSRALILSLGAATLTPPLWLPLLEGYPDIGAAACIAFAAGLFLRELEKPGSFARAFGAGIVLGLAVLLRRHFVYPALALLITSAGFSLAQIGRARHGRGRPFGRFILSYALCGLGLAGTLFAAAPEFVRTALTVDFGALYLSYQRPVLVFLRFLAGGFGVGLLLAACGGLALLGRCGAREKRTAAFISIFTLLWLALWCLGPDQLGHHYMLHAVPLFIAVGFAGWLDYAQGSRKNVVLAAALVLLLCANSAWALWFSPTGVWPNDNGAPGLLSAPRPPVIRSDYDEWLRLADYVRRTTGPEDRIMVVGSSFVFNQDIFFNIYNDILGAPGMAPRFPKSPEIDHEEPAPLDVFAAATVYVVPQPPQYHLDPAGQRVVTAAADQFPPPPARAPLFHADEGAFHLDNGVTVRIWRRKPWTPGALRDALEDIRRDGPDDANFAQDWAATSLPVRAQIHTDRQKLTSVLGVFAPSRQKLDLFFRYPLSAGSYRIGLSAAGNCPDPQFHLELSSAQGHADEIKTFAPVLVPGDVYADFTVAGKSQDYLSLGLSTAATMTCIAGLRALRLEKMP